MAFCPQLFFATFQVIWRYVDQGRTPSLLIEKFLFDKYDLLRLSDIKFRLVHGKCRH